MHVSSACRARHLFRGEEERVEHIGENSHKRKIKSAGRRPSGRRGSRPRTEASKTDRAPRRTKQERQARVLRRGKGPNPRQIKSNPGRSRKTLWKMGGGKQARGQRCVASRFGFRLERRTSRNKRGNGENERGRAGKPNRLP